MTKNCFWCSSPHVKKNGKKGKRQLYKCLDCGRQFIGGRRLDAQQLITDYVKGKQTLAELSRKYGICVKTVWNHLKGMRHVRVISRYKEVVVNMDTTYWGRGLGLMVIKDTFRNKILWYKFVRSETVADYLEGVAWLCGHGFRIHGIVCDGTRGLFAALRPYPVQMCQFHQVMIVRRYLTLRPELPAAVELLHISNMLARTDKESFVRMLDGWAEKWKDFLKERSVDSRTGRSSYTHRRIRSAFLSLRRNMP